jgi:hypothetical protein
MKYPERKKSPEEGRKISRTFVIERYKQRKTYACVRNFNERTEKSLTTTPRLFEQKIE